MAQTIVNNVRWIFRKENQHLGGLRIRPIGQQRTPRRHRSGQRQQHVRFTRAPRRGQHTQAARCQSRKHEVNREITFGDGAPIQRRRKLVRLRGRCDSGTGCNSGYRSRQKLVLKVGRTHRRNRKFSNIRVGVGSKIEVSGWLKAHGVLRPWSRPFSMAAFHAHAAMPIPLIFANTVCACWAPEPEEATVPVPARTPSKWTQRFGEASAPGLPNSGVHHQVGWN